MSIIKKTFNMIGDNLYKMAVRHLKSSLFPSIYLSVWNWIAMSYVTDPSWWPGNLQTCVRINKIVKQIYLASHKRVNNIYKNKISIPIP